MRKAGRVQRRARAFLLTALGFSIIWAAYWLWPSGPSEPDFRFQITTTDVVFLDFKHDRVEDMRPTLPYFEGRSFHSASGSPLRPEDIIVDARDPRNVDSPEFYASFRLKKDATRADFVNAAGMIWAVCDAAIGVATEDRNKSPAFLPAERGRSCDFLFPAKKTVSQGSG